MSSLADFHVRCRLLVVGRQLNSGWPVFLRQLRQKFRVELQAIEEIQIEGTHELSRPVH